MRWAQRSRRQVRQQLLGGNVDGLVEVFSGAPRAPPAASAQVPRAAHRSHGVHQSDEVLSGSLKVPHNAQRSSKRRGVVLTRPPAADREPGLRVDGGRPGAGGAALIRYATPECIMKIQCGTSRSKSALCAV
jgi:hypothetical protein